MYYTYLIRSLSHPNQTYVGFTHDLKKRIATHNTGGSPHTSKFLPWQLEFYAAFRTEERALAFERYLKSHSGQAFTRKRLSAQTPPTWGTDIETRRPRIDFRNRT